MAWKEKERHGNEMQVNEWKVKETEGMESEGK
jgi:hypothetical protein